MYDLFSCKNRSLIHLHLCSQDVVDKNEEEKRLVVNHFVGEGEEGSRQFDKSRQTLSCYHGNTYERPEGRVSLNLPVKDDGY